MFSSVMSSFRFCYKSDLPEDLSVSSLPAHKPQQQLASSRFPPSHASSSPFTSSPHHSSSPLKGPLQLSLDPAILSSPAQAPNAPQPSQALCFSVQCLDRALLSPRSLCEWDTLLRLPLGNVTITSSLRQRGGKSIKRWKMHLFFHFSLLY